MARLPVLIRGGRSQALLIALPILGLTLLCLLQIPGPAYRSDEVAYLAHAASLAGKQNGLAGSWYAGYSLLLSPFFRLAPGVQQAWPAAIVLNGLALITSLLCLWRSLKRSGTAGRERALLLVLLSLLVLSTTAYIGWAFGNCLLMALIAGVALLFAGPDVGRRQALGAGLLLGYATWVHPTGLLLLIAATLACLHPTTGSPRWRPAGLMLAIGLGMAFTYLRLIHPAIAALHGGGQGHYDSQISAVLGQLHSAPLATLATLAVGVINGLATSAIASFGYIGVALMALLPRRPSPPPAAALGVGSRRVLVFLLSSWGLLVLFSAALLPHEPTDLQLAFHLRYTQPVFPGLVLYGMALAPQRQGERLRAWLISAVPILLALLIAGLVVPYRMNYSVVDQISAVTFTLGLNVLVMLSGGLATTAAVQLLGWRAFLPLAAGLSVLGWIQMQRIHRRILFGDSRPPAMAAAATTLTRAGLRTCVDLTETDDTPGEHDRLMRYYLAGRPVRFYGPGEAPPQHCDVRIRPLSASAPPTDPHPAGVSHPPDRSTGERPACRALLVDTYANQLLEDCRQPSRSAGMAIETRLLPARRDLVSLRRTRQLRPSGDAIVALLHADALPPQTRRDGAWWRALSGPMPLRPVIQGQSLLHGPYLSLPAGRYRVVYDGLAISDGALRMAVTSDEGRQELASRRLGPGTAPAWIDLRLERPQQNVEVTLRALSNGRVRLPSTLMVFGDPPPRSGPWSDQPQGR